MHDVSYKPCNLTETQVAQLLMVVGPPPEIDARDRWKMRFTLLQVMGLKIGGESLPAQRPIDYYVDEVLKGIDLMLPDLPFRNRYEAASGFIEHVVRIKR